MLPPPRWQVYNIDERKIASLSRTLCFDGEPLIIAKETASSVFVSEIHAASFVEKWIIRLLEVPDGNLSFV